MCIMTRENSIVVVASLIVHSWGEGVSWGVDFSGLKKKKKSGVCTSWGKRDLDKKGVFQVIPAFGQKSK